MALEPLGIQAVAAGVPGFTKALGSMDKSITGTGRTARKFADGFTQIGGFVQKAALGIGAAAVAGLGAAGGAFFKLAADAAPLQGVMVAFDGIAAAAGKSGDEMLAALRQASGGMITNRDLMLQFNKASALVSKDFAVGLPDAFDVLSKASLATGDSLDFLLQSFTLGIGRLQPLILDNLGVQVSLTEAYEAYADANGLVASELTKTEQQMALQAITIKKLNAVFGDLPGVAGSAVGQFGNLQSMMKNLKDEIGLALLPAFGDLLSGITPLIQEALPRILELFNEKIGPAIQRFVGFLLNLIDTLRDTGSIMTSEFGEALGALLPQELGDKFSKFWKKIIDGFFTVKQFIVDNKDIIIGAIKGIGVVLAAAGITKTIFDIIRVLSLLTNPIGIIVLLAGALGAAWTTNFLGIRDTLTEFWETKAKPIFKQIVLWLQENIPKAIAFVKEFWESTLLPMWEGLKAAAIPVLLRVKRFIDETIIPAFKRVVAFIKETVMPIIQGIFGKQEAEEGGLTLPTSGIEKAFGKIKGIVNAIGALFSGQGDMADEAGQALGGLIGEDLAAGIIKIIDGIKMLVAAFQEHWPVIKEQIALTIAFIKETFLPTFNLVVENVIAIVASLADLIGEELQAIAAFWAEHGDTVIEYIGFLARFVGAIIQNLILLITTVVRVGLAILRGDWEEAFEAIKDFIGQFFQNALAIVGQNIDSFLEPWQGIATNIGIIIETLVGKVLGFFEGLWTGITDIVNNIWTTVTEVFQGIVDTILNILPEGFTDALKTIADVLGLGSPSKVFENIGADIAGGLQAGLAGIAPTIAMQTAPVASPGRQGNTNNFNMTINSSAPTEQVAMDFQMMQALASRRR